MFVLSGAIAGVRVFIRDLYTAAQYLMSRLRGSLC